MFAWMGGSKKKLKQGSKQHGRVGRQQGTKKAASTAKPPTKSPGSQVRTRKPACGNPSTLPSPRSVPVLSRPIEATDFMDAEGTEFGGGASPAVEYGGTDSVPFQAVGKPTRHPNRAPQSLDLLAIEMQWP